MWVLRALSVSAGTLAVVAAIFLYEDDERKVQSVLEKSWLKITDAETAVHRRIALFLQAIARWASALLNQLFGERIFSSKALGVSVCLTTLSILAGCLMIVPLSNRLFWPLVEDRMAIGTQLLLHTWISGSEDRRTVLLLGVLALSWAIWISSRLPHAPITTVLYFLFILFAWQPVNPSEIGWTGFAAKTIPVAIYLAAITVALFAFSTVAAARQLLQRQSTAAASPTVVLIVLLLITGGMAVLLLPIVGLRHLPACDGCLRQNLRLDETGVRLTFTVMSSQFMPIWYAANAMFAWLLSSLYVVPVLMLVPVLMFALLLHRLAWTVLERPLYAVQRFGIFRHRKVLAGVGLTLIAFGSPGVGTALKALRNLF